MNIRIPIFLCVGLAALIANTGCSQKSASIALASDEHPTKYILILGDGQNGRVKFTNREAFKSALPSGGSAWNSEIKVTDDQGQVDMPIEKHDPASSPTPGEVGVSYVTIVQVKHTIPNPHQTPPPDQVSTMHVTQKVGLNNLEQVRKLLKELKEYQSF